MVAAVCLALAVGASEADAQSGMTSPEDYRVGFGDVLTVTVWKYDELTVTVPVRPDGRITVPLVGDVQAEGKSSSEIQTQLTEAFEQFVTAPAVSVLVQQVNSLKVFIVGEVATPGVFDLIRPTRLIEALAMAGGLTEFAKLDEIVLLRDTPDGETRLTLSYKAIVSGRNLQENLLLQPGDTIIVP